MFRIAKNVVQRDLHLKLSHIFEGHSIGCTLYFWIIDFLILYYIISSFLPAEGLRNDVNLILLHILLFDKGCLKNLDNVYIHCQEGT